MPTTINNNDHNDRDNNNLNSASQGHNARTAMMMRAWQRQPRGSLASHWSAVAYVIDSPNRRLDSYMIHTQPTSADVGDSCRIDTSADVG
jgi:hypothetical protein